MLLGLASVGKTFWILHVALVKVFAADSIALLALTPLTISVVSVPLPLLLGMPVHWVAFYVVETLVLVGAFTGIGLWAGAAYPNFDESRGGTPDVMSMFLMSLLCLGVAVLILGIGGLALAGPPFGFRWGGLANGVLVMVLSLEVGLALLLWGVLRAAKRYGALEVRFS